MEHRLDLKNLLLDRLPEQERRHVVKVMRRALMEKARPPMAEDIRSNQPIDLTGADELELW